jgi:sporulation protein YunB
MLYAYTYSVEGENMLRYNPYFRKKQWILWLIIIIGIILYIFNFIDKNIRPTVLTLSEIKARAITTETINKSVKKKIGKDINYNDLIFVRYGTDGKVALMQANTILMNNIAAEVALEVQKELTDISASKIEVPLKNVFDTQILRLPSIKLTIVPQGAVSVDFATEFKQSGINQTRHRIYLVINTSIRMIVPLISDDIEITTNIPIAETIIVGDVPEQYIELPKEEDAIEIVD